MHLTKTKLANYFGLFFFGKGLGGDGKHLGFVFLPPYSEFEFNLNEKFYSRKKIDFILEFKENVYQCKLHLISNPSHLN